MKDLHVKAFAIHLASTDLGRDTLDQFVDMAAESSELECDDTPEATRDVIKAVEAYERDAKKALEEWVKKNPDALKEEFDADDLWDEKGSYLILMTLRGEGVGIWDGDWDHFFKEGNSGVDKLSKHLERKLNKHADDTGSGKVNEAFDNAAWEQCGNDEDE